MTPQESVATGALVFGLTQLVKWSGLPDRQGPIAVVILSVFAVALWAWSADQLARHLVFDLACQAVEIALSAAGIFGFSRAAAALVTKATPPPTTGAGSERTLP